MAKIKINSVFIVLLMVALLSYFVIVSLKTTPVKILSLSAGEFEHIQFSTKKANKYHYHEDELHIDVDNSASFLMRAFDRVKHVNKVSFEWQSMGLPAINDAAHEKQRSGDDAVFKLGLLIETHEALTEFFLPAWMRRVDGLLQFHSDEMFFLVAGAKHAAKQHWQGPYNQRITMISMNNMVSDNGWNKASYEFSEPVKVVALWLMADGDDTGSTFNCKIKNIVLSEQETQTLATNH